MIRCLWNRLMTLVFGAEEDFTYTSNTIPYMTNDEIDEDIQHNG